MKYLLLALLLLCGGTTAVTLTINDPNCSSFAMNGNALTCVPVTPVPPDPPPPSGLAGCVTQGMATMTAQAIQVPFASASQWFTRSYGSWNTQVWVFSVAVPADAPPSSMAGRFTVSEYQGTPTTRQISVSTTACDFNPATALNISSYGQTAETYWGVGAPSANWAGMAPGVTYYISVRNWGQSWPNPPASSCPVGNCPAIMGVQPPS